MSTTDIRHLDPFDIKLNRTTDHMFSTYTSSNSSARRDPNTDSWDYFSTLDFGIEEPSGLVKIPNTPLMIVNEFFKRFAVFNASDKSPVRLYETENFGLRHMLFREF